MPHEYDENQILKMAYNLFGIASDGEVASHKVRFGILSDNQYNTMYLPVVFNSDEYDASFNKPGQLEKPRSVKCRAIFPFKEHINRYEHLSVFNKSIIPSPDHIIASGQVVYIEEFINNIPKIQKFLANNKSLTLIINNLAGCMKFITHGIEEIQSGFKYSTCTSYIAPGNWHDSNCPEDQLMLFITIHNLANAVPIFNRRKVDGLAISVVTIWPESSIHTGCLYSNSDFNVIVSNFEDNIFVVDGERINQSRKIPKDIQNHMLASLEKDFKRRAVPKKLMKAGIISKEAKVKMPSSQLVEMPAMELGKATPFEDYFIEPAILGGGINACNGSSSAQADVYIKHVPVTSLDLSPPMSDVSLDND